MKICVQLDRKHKWLHFSGKQVHNKNLASTSENIKFIKEHNELYKA